MCPASMPLAIAPVLAEPVPRWRRGRWSVYGAARALGHASLPAGLDQLERDAGTALTRHRRFQRALWALYAAPPFSAARANPET